MSKLPLALLVVFAAPPSHATTWHLAADGDPFGDGLSWETAARSLDHLLFRIAPGDIILFGPGDFEVRDTIDCSGLSIEGAGSAQTRLVPGERAANLASICEARSGATDLSGLSFSPQWHYATQAITAYADTTLRLADVDSHNGIVVAGKLRATNVALAATRISIAGDARLEDSQLHQSDIDVTNEGWLTAKNLTLTNAGISLSSTAGARITDCVGENWGVHHIGAGPLEMRRNVFSNNQRPVVETQSTSLHFEANFVEDATQGLVIALNFNQPDLRSTVLDNVFDGVKEPIRIEQIGTHNIIHNTFLAPSASPVQELTLVACTVEARNGDPVGANGVLQNNAIKGYQVIVSSGAACPFTLGGNAWFDGRGDAALFGAVPAATDLPDTRFFLNDRYRPRSDQSVLVGNAPQPAFVKGMLLDFYGHLRSWPATIGAVERTIRVLSLSPETAPIGTKAW